MDTTRIGSRVSVPSVVLLSLLAFGCDEESPPTVVDIAIHAESDPGMALAGMTVSAAGATLGVSDATGLVRAQLSGDLGVVVPVSATCPEGYRPGRASADVTLRPTFDVTGQARGLDVTLSCPPASRRGVLVVRAGGEGSRMGLPVRIDGRDVAVTDASGVAHVPIDMQPGGSFRVEIATATVNPMLRPADPATSFTFEDHDEIFVFDQNFDEARPVAAPRRGGGRRPVAPPPVPQGPPRPVQIRQSGW